MSHTDETPGRSLTPARGRRAAGRPPKRPAIFVMQMPIARRTSIILAVSGLASVVLIWSVITYGGFVSAFFLPTPTAVADAFVQLILHKDFLSDIAVSFGRILAGFGISAAVAIPIGIGIGAFRAIQSALEPIFAAARYMPASAFIPLLIIWFGIGESEKIAVIVIGVFFPLVLLVADVASNTPRQFLQIAYTLGASQWQGFWRVFLRSSLPGIVDILRVAFGWAWTYLIVAELVAASKGIGYVILASSRYQRTDEIIAGVLTIGALGLLTDLIFRIVYVRLFPYSERVAQR